MSKPITPLLDATKFLAGIDKDWAQLINTVGICAFSPRAERDPYQSLVRAVAYQQLHTKAGDSIFKKFLACHSGVFPTPTQVLKTEFDDLRACGFSGRKIETIQGIANAALTGVVPTRETADTLDNETLITRLIALKGIGRWTVEMMLMFTLARTDILPVGDFAIREGYKRLKNLETAPTPRVLAAIGEAWQPHRTVASWYLWRMPK